MERIIYLDIDGVLNTYTDFINFIAGKGVFLHYHKGNFIERSKLNRLHRLIVRLNAKVVIVSSWVNSNRTAKDVCDFLGLPYYGEPVCTSGGLERGRGVKEHMQQHGLEDHQIVIIDDAGERMYDDLSRCVVVDGQVGLTDADCIAVERLFAQKI